MTYPAKHRGSIRHIRVSIEVPSEEVSAMLVGLAVIQSRTMNENGDRDPDHHIVDGIKYSSYNSARHMPKVVVRRAKA